MHIEINQAMQKIAANRSRKFEAEEIDLVLNKVMGRFIQSKLRPKADNSGGFSIDQMGLDALRPLIVTNKELTAYTSTNGRYVSFLPPDYTHLLGDSSYLTALCGSVKKVIPEDVSMTFLRQDVSPKSLANFYMTMSITMSTKTVSIPGNLPYTNQFAGYLSKQDISFLTPFILQTFRRAGYDVYWEKFDDINMPSTYILVKVGIPQPASMIIDGTAVTQRTTLTRTLSKYNEVGVIRPNRLTSSAIIPSLLSTAFYTTSENTPISELEGNNLYVYGAESFIVNKMIVSYLRKPQSISLILGTDCELAEEFHQALCDLAVEYLKGRLGNPQDTALATNDNERRVTL